jgi:hypothetical protein
LRRVARNSTHWNVGRLGARRSSTSASFVDERRRLSDAVFAEVLGFSSYPWSKFVGHGVVQAPSKVTHTTIRDEEIRITRTKVVGKRVVVASVLHNGERGVVMHSRKVTSSRKRAPVKG